VSPCLSRGIYRPPWIQSNPFYFMGHFFEGTTSQRKFYGGKVLLRADTINTLSLIFFKKDQTTLSSPNVNISVRSKPNLKWFYDSAKK
jgi:hypothetical protein